MDGEIRLPSPRVARHWMEKAHLFTTVKFRAAKVIHIGCGECKQAFLADAE